MLTDSCARCFCCLNCLIMLKKNSTDSLGIREMPRKSNRRPAKGNITERVNILKINKMKECTIGAHISN